MFFILSVVVSGLIVGALGRLAIPGPNPMSIGMTILVGVGGALVGGGIGAALFGSENGGIIILQVLVAAGIVWFLQRRQGANAP